MLKTVEKVLLLQELEVFRKATSEQLARLAIISTDRSFEEKEVLFEKGHLCDSLLLLVDGKVQLGPPGQGSVVESTILDPLSFFARQRHNTAAAALTSGILLETPQHNLADLLTSEGEFGWIVIGGNRAHRTTSDEPADPGVGVAGHGTFSTGSQRSPMLG